MIKKQKLELTWVGKDVRPKLEPRILLENTSKSYHAKHRVSENDIFDNRLIFGDNLLALKALEQEFIGKVKCIYIDPPFNTGEMFENYDDGLEHSIWLGQMRERFISLRQLLSIDGSLFVHLNDDELDYCKVLLDEIFGRSNFVNRITISARSPSAFSTVNPGVFKASEYILWYAREKSSFQENSGRIKRQPDYAYSKWLVNPNDDCQNWKLIPLMEAYEASPQSRSRRPDSVLEHFHQFIINNANQVCRSASISDTGAGEAIIALKQQSLSQRGRVLKLERDRGLDTVYVVDGQQLIFYSKNIAEIEGELTASAIMSNVWSDIAWEGIAGEGAVTFRKGKKPERLIKRCLELASQPNDLILDSFAGSGTTGAVAHKMGRRWIMIELEDHCHTHVIPRLQKVIDGTDQGGISQTINWQGGGGFRYYSLAPSLLKQDSYSQWVINKEYNPEMLAEAICKLEGFSYAPSTDHYWQHGFSTENDFIYVTTQSLTTEQLQALSDEVGQLRTLLVCCAAFRGDASRFPNLTIKKIPKMVLQKCEWSHDDYSLNVENLPQAPKVELSTAAPSTGSGRTVSANQPGLFGDNEGSVA